MLLRFLLLLSLLSFEGWLAELPLASADSKGEVGERSSRTINQRIAPIWKGPHEFRFQKELPNGSLTTLRVDCRTGDITVLQKDARNARRSYLQGGSLPRSQPSATEAHVRFDNQSDQSVTLFWIDTKGRQAPYGTLDPGESKRQHTYAGHAWFVRAEDGTFYGSLIAEGPETIAEIKTVFPAPVALDRRSRRETSKPSGSYRSPNSRYEYRIEGGSIQIRAMDHENAVWTALDLEASADELVNPEWSPDGTVLAAWKVTQNEVAESRLIESSPPGGGRARLIEHTYRLPGDAYDEYTLVLFDVATKRQIQTDLPRFDFNRPRLNWFADHHIAVNKVDRGHQRFRLFVVDAETGVTRTAIDERSPTFLWTAHGPPVPLLTFLESTEEVIYSSECAGFRHLYRLDLRQTDDFLRCTVSSSAERKQRVRHLSGFDQAAITKGDFLVREIVRIDEQNRTIDLLVGQRYDDQDPYHRHLMRVSFDGRRQITATDGDGDHSVQLSPDGRHAVVTHSRVDRPPVHELVRMADGRCVAELMRAERITSDDTDWTLPRVLSAAGRDGKTKVWGNLYFPNDFDPGRENGYPVIEAIYAGPHDSHVPKRYQHSKRFEELTSLGFVVVQIDGMGTANRSKAFHDRCWQDLKDAGFPDRIAWLKSADERYPALDLSRVGIFGTSAGGQSACGALLFHGDFYKAAYASCGCHDNRMDKASWNEQWMGYPVGKHYAASSNIDNADRLTGHLSLLVGELDRNVPPESTYRLVDALVKADKDFEFLIIPGMGHSDGGSYGRRRMRDFFVRTLQPDRAITPVSRPRGR